MVIGTKLTHTHKILNIHKYVKYTLNTKCSLQAVHGSQNALEDVDQSLLHHWYSQLMPRYGMTCDDAQQYTTPPDSSHGG